MTAIEHRFTRIFRMGAIGLALVVAGVVVAIA